MLKLSHTTKKAALAGLLAAGLAGSAVVTLKPVAAYAQDRDDGYYQDRDNGYRGNWDDGYRSGWNDRNRADWYRDHPYWRDRTWVGIGVPGFGIGFYDYPYDNGYYGPYCSAYDYYNGFCSY
ncbi:MAG TPA: hypothetical protein VMF67_17645 [Rhizomicrobium sp.]|nr:hypothetical protein [Rhizomicrobium sp.]